jgi:hypothetical protein
MSKKLAKQIARESNFLGDLVERCIIHCGWEYNENSCVWLTSGYVVTDLALHMATTAGAGLDHVEHIIRSVNQPETYDLIRNSWEYLPTFTKYGSIKWVNERICS